MSLNIYINGFGTDLNAAQKRRATALAQEKMRRGISEYEAAQSAVNEARNYVEETAEQRRARIAEEQRIAAERERARLAEIARLEALRKAEEERLERERIQRLNNRKASATSELERKIDSCKSEIEHLNSQLKSLNDNILKAEGSKAGCLSVKLNHFGAKDFSGVETQLSKWRSEAGALQSQINSDNRVAALNSKKNAIQQKETIEEVETEMRNLPSSPELGGKIKRIDDEVNKSGYALTEAHKFLTELAKIDSVIKDSTKYFSVKESMTRFYKELNILDDNSVKSATSKLEGFVKDLKVVAEQEKDTLAILKIESMLSNLQVHLRNLRNDARINAEFIEKITLDDADAHKCFSEILERGLYQNELAKVYRSYLSACEEKNVPEMEENLEKLRRLNEKSEKTSLAQAHYLKSLERRNTLAVQVNKKTLENEFSLENYLEQSEILDKEADELELELLCTVRDEMMDVYDASMESLGYKAITKVKEIDAVNGVVQRVYAKKGELDSVIVVETDFYGNRKDYAVGIELTVNQKTHKSSADEVKSVCQKTKEARKLEMKRQLAINHVPTEAEDCSPYEDDEPEFEPFKLDDRKNPEEITRFLEVAGCETDVSNGKLTLRKIKKDDAKGDGVINVIGVGSPAKNVAEKGQQLHAQLPK